MYIVRQRSLFRAKYLFAGDFAKAYLAVGFRSCYK